MLTGTPAVDAVDPESAWPLCGWPNLFAGQTAWRILNLAAGWHGVVCFVQDEQMRVPRFMVGMGMVFSVGQVTGCERGVIQLERRNLT